MLRQQKRNRANPNFIFRIRTSETQQAGGIVSQVESLNQIDKPARPSGLRDDAFEGGKMLRILDDLLRSSRSIASATIIARRSPEAPPISLSSKASRMRASSFSRPLRNRTRRYRGNSAVGVAGSLRMDSSRAGVFVPHDRQTRSRTAGDRLDADDLRAKRRGRRPRRWRVPTSRAGRLVREGLARLYHGFPSVGTDSECLQIPAIVTVILCRQFGPESALHFIPNISQRNCAFATNLGRRVVDQAPHSCSEQSADLPRHANGRRACRGS